MSDAGLTQAALPEILWMDRPEPYFAAHPTLVRTKPLNKASALAGLRSGWSYFAPVPRIALGNKKEHCATSFDALVVDVDRDEGSDPDDLLTEAKAMLDFDLWPPTVAVYSGRRGLHLYWKLDDDLPIAEIEAFNRALAQVVGGDSCHDRTHLFRNPGTTHPKSGKKIEILDLAGTVHSIQAMKSTLGSYLEPLDATEPRSGSANNNKGTAKERDAEWRMAADSLTGWSAPAELDLTKLLHWQQAYVRHQPAKGWRRKDMTRSEAEQEIISRLVGKGFGASDAQIKQIADQYFAKHREECQRRGDQYLQRSIESARRHLYEQGWITSPSGGWPRRRDANFRHLTPHDLNAALSLVRGQALAEWATLVCEELGCSRSTAYRISRRLCDEGLVEIEGGVIRWLIEGDLPAPGGGKAGG